MKKNQFLDELDKIFTTANVRTMVSKEYLPINIKVNINGPLSFIQVLQLLELANKSNSKLSFKIIDRKIQIEFVRTILLSSSF